MSQGIIAMWNGFTDRRNDMNVPAFYIDVRYSRP